MNFLDKWYVGYRKNAEPELFTHEFPIKDVPQTAGYDSVAGPYDSEEEAQDCLNNSGSLC